MAVSHATSKQPSLFNKKASLVFANTKAAETTSDSPHTTKMASVLQFFPKEVGFFPFQYEGSELST